MFIVGDVVKILPEYQDEGDAEITWIVCESEEKGRVTIVASDSPMSIKPSCVVAASWIEPDLNL